MGSFENNKSRQRLRMGEILVNQKLITRRQLIEGLDYQKANNIRLGQALVDLHFTKEEEILKAISRQTKIPLANPYEVVIDSSLVELFPLNLVMEHLFFPIKKTEEYILILVSEPFNITTEDKIKEITKLNIRMALLSEREIKALIRKAYSGADVRADEHDEEADIYDIDISNNNIEHLTNTILFEALKEKATDIHIETFENNVSVRYRIDGELHDNTLISKKMLNNFVSRFKVLANLDIAEKRKPQDGRLQIKTGEKTIDVRVSVLPTIYGERLCIRLLDQDAIQGKPEDLGYEENTLNKIQKLIKQPFGMVLVTGPTDSGKTTSLYTFLNEINDRKKNIMTIEDPVEYRLYGINQVQINPKVNLTFAEGLKSILRQNPDVIMVGEVRDDETADIAIRSSNTGHLVFASLHTNDALSSISRFMSMGIAPHFIADSVTAVLNQRLVRKLCNHCKTPYKIEETDEESLVLGKHGITIFKAVGCEHCRNTGYSGRIPVHELLVITDNIRRAIIQRTSDNLLKEIALKDGFIPLSENAISRLFAGLTSFEQIKHLITKI